MTASSNQGAGGEMHINLDQAITRVVLSNLAHVTGHFISTENGVRIHEINFGERSHARLVIRAEGTLATIDGENLHIQVKPDGSLHLDQAP